jgi:uncharacterized protein (DUF2249 family)
MTDVVIASHEADARAAEAMEQHHAQLSGALATLVERLVVAASRGDLALAQEARKRLAAWCQRELVPHALAEEQTLYPAARVTRDGRLLVDAMTAEHQVISGLVRFLADGDSGTGVDADAGGPVRQAANAVALRVVFESHLTKENDLIIPLLLRTPDVSMADLLGGMHEMLGDHVQGSHGSARNGRAGQSAEAEDLVSAGPGSGHTCSCGESEPAGYPELDARSIPHAIRHATIVGALETVEPGGGLVLVAPHDPLPLLDQIAARWPGRFTVGYLERGPQAWRLALMRETD